jgi:hypothetical protein
MYARQVAPSIGRRTYGHATVVDACDDNDMQTASRLARAAAEMSAGHRHSFTFDGRSYSRADWTGHFGRLNEIAVWPITTRRLNDSSVHQFPDLIHHNRR